MNGVTAGAGTTLGRSAAMLLVAALVVATAAASPARARGGEDDAAETQVGGARVAVHPAIAKAGHPVLLRAELARVDDGPDDSVDDEPDDSVDDEPDDSVDDGPDDSVDDGPDDSVDDGPDDSVDDGPDDAVNDGPDGSEGASETVGAARRNRDAIAFTVDWGDGSAVERLHAAGRGTSRKAIGRHRYAAEGAYTATVTITGDGEPVTATVTVQVGGGNARLRGADRFATARRIANEDFPTDGSAEAVVLSRADSFADALSSASLATLETAPVLLVGRGPVPDDVTEEIARALGEGGTVYVLGGEQAIPETVVEQLRGLGYHVERLAGADRVETSVKIARFLVDHGATFETVVLAGAGSFADALAGAAIAAEQRAPVLLTGGDALDPRVGAFLATLPDSVDVLAVGGDKVLTDEVLADVTALGRTVERVAGSNRYATAAKLAARSYPAPRAVVIATGGNFPDALAGAPLAGRRRAPILLVGPTLPPEVRRYLQEHADTINRVYVLGGESAVPTALREEVDALIAVPSPG